MTGRACSIQSMKPDSAPEGPAHADVDGLGQVVAHVGDLAPEPDVGDLGLGAAGRAAREVHADDPGVLLGPGAPAGRGHGADRLAGQLLVEEPGPLDGPLLGLDDGVPAELGAGAGHHPAGERPRIGRVLLHQVLGQHVVDAVLGDAGEGDVLIGADAHRSVAVGLGQTGRLHQLETVHPSHRHRAADIEETVLLLGMDADVVAPVAAGQVLAGRHQLEAGPGGQLLAEALGPELLDQIAHAGQAPVLAVAELPEESGRWPG